MPAATSAPSFPDIIVTAWRDVPTAWRRLPLQSAIACAVLFGQALVGWAAGLDAETSRIGDLALSIVSAVLLLPYEIALYRAYILGEAAYGYSFALTPRFARYLLWSAIVWAPLGLIYVVNIAETGSTETSGIAVILILIFALLFIAAGFCTALLFPAIVLDAPGATLTHAVADMRGHIPKIAAAMLAALLPALVLAIVRMLLQPAGMDESSQSIIFPVLEAFASFLGTTVFVVAVARLYEALAVRLRGDTVPAILPSQD